MKELLSWLIAIVYMICVIFLFTIEWNMSIAPVIHYHMTGKLATALCFMYTFLRTHGAEIPKQKATDNAQYLKIVTVKLVTLSLIVGLTYVIV